MCQNFIYYLASHILLLVVWLFWSLDRNISLISLSRNPHNTVCSPLTVCNYLSKWSLLYFGKDWRIITLYITCGAIMSFSWDTQCFLGVKRFWIWKTGLNIEINPGFMTCLGMTALNLFMCHLWSILIPSSLCPQQGFSTSKLWIFCLVWVTLSWWMLFYAS